MWIQIMCRMVVFIGVVLYLTPDTCSTPVKRFILDTVNCSVPINCESEAIAMICATDKKTYNNSCHLKAVNQNRTCDEAIFKPIVFVHDGQCDVRRTS